MAGVPWSEEVHGSPLGRVCRSWRSSCSSPPSWSSSEASRSCWSTGGPARPQASNPPPVAAPSSVPATPSCGVRACPAAAPPSPASRPRSWLPGTPSPPARRRPRGRGPGIRARAAGQAHLPRPAGQGPRHVQRLPGLAPVAHRHQRRDLGRAGGGAHPRRRRRGPHHASCSTSCGPRSRSEGITEPAGAGRRPQGPAQGQAQRRRPHPRTSSRAAPTCGSSSASTASARPPRSARSASSRSTEGRSVVMAAGDTFRAAAAEQLETWADRAGADFHRGEEGGDPSSVIFDAIAKAGARDIDLVLADTAGRLHTKTNLMEELAKVRRVADRDPGNVTEVLLVLDATTGQNGLQQAKQFSEATAVHRGGAHQARRLGQGRHRAGHRPRRAIGGLGLPIKLVGLGESADDLIDFDPDAFVDALFDGLTPTPGSGQPMIWLALEAADAPVPPRARRRSGCTCSTIRFVGVGRIARLRRRRRRGPGDRPRPPASSSGPASAAGSPSAATGRRPRRRPSATSWPLARAPGTCRSPSVSGRGRPGRAHRHGAPRRRPGATWCAPPARSRRRARSTTACPSTRSAGT